MGRAVHLPAPRKTPVLLLLAGAVLTLLLANALMRKLGAPARQAGLDAPAETTHAMTPQRRVEPPSQAPTVAAESTPVATPPGPKPESKPEPQPAAPAPAPTPSPAPVRPAPVTAPAPATLALSEGGDARRYATTWINVRATRRNSSPVLRVLRPGEAVQVDSLAQGWYRVVSVGGEPGYVDRRLLDSAPGTASP